MTYIRARGGTHETCSEREAASATTSTTPPAPTIILEIGQPSSQLKTGDLQLGSSGNQYLMTTPGQETVGDLRTLGTKGPLCDRASIPASWVMDTRSSNREMEHRLLAALCGKVEALENKTSESSTAVK